MRSRDPRAERRPGPLGAIQFDLAFRALLVGVLWSLLRVLGGDLTSFVSVAILGAVFGPDALRAGRDWLSRGPGAK